MLRASAASEKIGVPSSSIVCDGFLALAAAASIGQGMPNLALAVMPGHPGVQSNEELRRNVFEGTMDQVGANLTAAPAAATVTHFRNSPS